MITNRPAKSYPIVRSFFEAVRQSKEGSLPLGAAGFCWGGKHTILLAAGEDKTIVPGSNSVSGGGTGKKVPLIDAGFTGHPSLLALPGDIEKITLPVSFALAELDTVLRKKDIETVKGVMSAKEETGGEVVVYPGAGHGFCVRADTAVEDSARQCREAEEQAIEFFRRCFARM